MGMYSSNLGTQEQMLVVLVVLVVLRSEACGTKGLTIEKCNYQGIVASGAEDP